jgi:hypothetical protein
MLRCAARQQADAAAAASVPITREITIDGVTQDLSADRTWATSGGGGLTIEEVDGTPTVAATKLILPNGSLSVSGTEATYTPPGGAMTLLASGVLGSDAASIPLSSISGSYRHLRLMLSLRTTEAVVQSGATIYVNADTTAANYRGQRTAFQNAATIYLQNAGAVATLAQLLAAGASARANSYAAYEIDVYDYASTAQIKTAHARGDLIQADATGNYVTALSSGAWLSTAAITALTVVPTSGDLAAGCTWALYGLA